MTVVIPADVAAWIRDVVLPVAYRNAQSDRTYCACQWGVCGHCQAGRHGQCAVIAWGGAPRPTCDTYITDASGHVVGTADTNKVPGARRTGAIQRG